jgi:hypothetical protein
VFLDAAVASQSCCCSLFLSQCVSVANAATQCLAVAAKSAHLITKAAVANADVLQLPVLLQHGTQRSSCLSADGMAAADELLQDSVVLQSTAELCNILQAPPTAVLVHRKAQDYSEDT